MRTGVLIAAVTGLLVAPEIALACCSCDRCGCSEGLADDGIDATLTAPADGARDVPLNARVWLGGILAGAVDLRSDEEAAFLRRSVIASGSSAIEVFTPDADLLPSTDYTVYVDGNAVALFTTGEGRDTEPPSPPETRELRVETRAAPAQAFSSPEDGWTSVAVETVHEGLVAVGDRGSASLDEVGIDGFVDMVTTELEPTWRFGDEDCSVVLETGDRVAVRFGAYDLPGNFSGWSDQSEAVVAASCDGTAGVAGRARPLGWSLLALVAAAGRRRRTM